MKLPDLILISFFLLSNMEHKIMKIDSLRDFVNSEFAELFEKYTSKEGLYENEETNN